MKKILPFSFAFLLAACGQPSSTATDSQTTKTTTTVTTTSSADAPAAVAPMPVTPVPPPAPTTLTQVNLDRVSTDMSQSEVEAIFGAPTSSSTEPIPIVGGTQTTYNYQSGGSAVTIVFKNNQVKEKSGTFGP